MTTTYTRITRARTEIGEVESRLKPSYKAGLFRPRWLTEELLEDERGLRYTATFNGPMRKKDGSDSVNGGERWFVHDQRGRSTFSDLDKIPSDLHALMIGAKHLHEMSL